MYSTARSFIEALGGYRKVSARFGIRGTTLHTHMTADALPPKWYDAFIELAQETGVEPPPRTLFAFAKLPTQPDLSLSQRAATSP